MDYYLTLIITLFLVGVSFFIMSAGFIKNKYVVLFGVLLFIGALVFFMIGFKEVLLI